MIRALGVVLLAGPLAASPVFALGGGRQGVGQERRTASVGSSSPAFDILYELRP